MSYAGKTVFVSGVYLLLLSIILMVVPNSFLSLFGVATTSEVWIRLAGMLFLYLGLFYVAAARGDWTAFIRMTIPLRLSVIVLLSLFIMFADAPVVLLLFGVIDVAMALWTATALKQKSLT